MFSVSIRNKAHYILGTLASLSYTLHFSEPFARFSSVAYETDDCMCLFRCAERSAYIQIQHFFQSNKSQGPAVVSRDNETLL